MSSPTEIAFEFVNGINAHDADRLCEIMSEDHLFINSLGSRLQGREKVRAAWLNYFEMFPDYSMNCTEIFERGVVVAMFGRASATHRGGRRNEEQHRWQIPAAWRAVIRQERVQIWQVFADNEPVRRFLADTSTTRRLSRLRAGLDRRRAPEMTGE